MTPWGDKEISRFKARAAMFVRRGWSPEAAAEFADRLALRDADRDDRRACIECSNLQRDGGCFPARQGRFPGVDKLLAPVQNILQRCPGFAWQTP